jgi:hypothetical protein
MGSKVGIRGREEGGVEGEGREGVEGREGR